MMRAPHLAALLLASLPALARAQGAGFGALVLSQPASTRALALGDAFPLNTTDSDAIFYNPAFGDRLRGIAIGLRYYVNDAAGDATMITASGATEWWHGAVGFGVRALQYRAWSEAAPGGVPASGTVASLAYARTVKGIRLAATGKIVDQHAGDDRSAEPALDLATGLDVAFLSVGLAVRNLGPDLRLDLPGGRRDAHIPLPRRVTLGATTNTMPLGPLDVLFSGAVSADEDWEVLAGAGVEVSYWPVVGRTFSARIGARRTRDDASPLTLGFGFTGDDIAIDYAFGDRDAGGPTHRVTLRWR